ncbi:MAG: hypothetical protein M3441_25815 [Chloroflexota bacterium]|nr:hypothetical protein [Chloroflexota bacterium]
MNPNYVKLSVLRAAIRDAGARKLNPEERRQHVLEYCRLLENAFKRTGWYYIALTLHELQREVRATASLTELLVQIERGAIEDIVSVLVPHSNTGPTGDLEPTSVETARANREEQN